MPDAIIHLRVPAALEGRWVRASRSVGQRLTDYITCAVEVYMQQSDGASMSIATDPAVSG